MNIYTIMVIERTARNIEVEAEDEESAKKIAIKATEERTSEDNVKSISEPWYLEYEAEFVDEQAQA